MNVHWVLRRLRSRCECVSERACVSAFQKCYIQEIIIYIGNYYLHSVSEMLVNDVNEIFRTVSHTQLLFTRAIIIYTGSFCSRRSTT